MIIKQLKYTLLSFLLMVGLFGMAQQDPQYTQYMYNMSVINPAYATEGDDINVGALYRSQWVGSVGAPNTGSLFIHVPLQEKIQVGLSVINDQIGDVVNETNVYADFAYILRLGTSTKLSLGVKAGATFFNTNFNGFIYSDALPDPAFANNLSKTFPNIGAGAYVFGDNYYVGFSAPNLLNSKHLENNSGIVANGVEEIHFFLTGGYVFEMNENLKLKPAFMTKAVSGAPLSVDLTANVLFNNVFEVGAGYRLDDAVTGLVNFRVSPSLRIGYAYDHTLSNLGRFNSGSHEIMILFDIDKLGTQKGYDKSPRFF
ncbi:type IX secretion system membrane protein PorP/SprF [Gelidibacter japonicus]|jgi:type IX secretion system PorP/SprF family membrane protein|uniref:PorP/SprF family type IX secretion system membrane protein n=1 Tax=Gelidibacter japonicus TaxID=1962232 RepID=UPI0013D854A0|nr:type IX secretion system membrane protein PorP/SprF [Gelidibacter japonicus]MCL8007801.1 type IX secretion system membrane protein PorP/SprF [Gelidibacter japonicus]